MSSTWGAKINTPTKWWSGNINQWDYSLNQINEFNSGAPLKLLGSGIWDNGVHINSSSHGFITNGLNSSPGSVNIWFNSYGTGSIIGEWTDEYTNVNWGIIGDTDTYKFNITNATLTGTVSYSNENFTLTWGNSGDGHKASLYNKNRLVDWAYCATPSNNVNIRNGKYFSEYYIRELRLWNRELTQEEINTSWNREKGKFLTGGILNEYNTDDKLFTFREKESVLPFEDDMKINLDSKLEEVSHFITSDDLVLLMDPRKDIDFDNNSIQTFGIINQMYDYFVSNLNTETKTLRYDDKSLIIKTTISYDEYLFTKNELTWGIWHYTYKTFRGSHNFGVTRTFADGIYLAKNNDNNNQYRLLFYGYRNSGFFGQGYSLNFNLNQWNHYQVIANSDGVIKIYLNNVLKNTYDYSDGFIRWAFYNEIRDINLQFTNSYVGPFYVYNRALSDSERNNLHNYYSKWYN